MPWHVAGKLKACAVVEGPDQLLGCARLNQDAVRVVVLHSDHLHPTHAVAHTAHRFPVTGGVKRPALEHACHFFLVCCMSSGFSDVELVQQRTLIAENKSNSFTRLYVDAFRFEENIAHFDLHRTGNLRGDARLADVLFPIPRSEEHTSELQSLIRISYAVVCLK